MKVLPSLFSCVYSKVKLFVFAINSRKRYSCLVWFIYGLEEKNSNSEVIFAVCRLPLTSCLTSLFSWKPRYLVLHIGGIKTVFTNGNWKLFWGLERKHKHETYTLLTWCLINFCVFIFRSYKLKTKRVARHDRRLMWLQYQIRKLHPAPFEIVSLVCSFYLIF